MSPKPKRTMKAKVNELISMFDDLKPFENNSLQNTPIKKSNEIRRLTKSCDAKLQKSQSVHEGKSFGFHQEDLLSSESEEDTASQESQMSKLDFAKFIDMSRQNGMAKDPLFKS